MPVACEICGKELVGVAYMSGGKMYCEPDILTLPDVKSYKVNVGEERLVKSQPIDLLESRGKRRGPKP